MQMTSYLQDKQLTIALQGEIDHHGAKATLRTVAEKFEVHKMVEDTAKVYELACAR